jgi:hypothetical protein
MAAEPPEPSSSGISAAESRDERLARNENTFRSVNERIEKKAASVGSENCQFVCECSIADCVERVILTRNQYEHVRAEGTRFFVVPGHENVAVEEVVETWPSYLVVEKDGRAGLVADLANPRDDS